MKFRKLFIEFQDESYNRAGLDQRKKRLTDTSLASILHLRFYTVRANFKIILRIIFTSVKSILNDHWSVKLNPTVPSKSVIVCTKIISAQCYIYPSKTFFFATWESACFYEYISAIMTHGIRFYNEIFYNYDWSIERKTVMKNKDRWTLLFTDTDN